MNGILRFSRRRFLLLAGWVGASLGMPLPLQARPAAAPRSEAARRLVEALQAHGSRHAIGAAYLRRHPEEHGTDALVDALLADHPALHTALHRERVQLRSVLDAGVRRDYSHGHTTVVDGWVLSRTDARLCALVAIQPV